MNLIPENFRGCVKTLRTNPEASKSERKASRVRVLRSIYRSFLASRDASTGFSHSLARFRNHLLSQQPSVNNNTGSMQPVSVIKARNLAPKTCRTLPCSDEYRWGSILIAPHDVESVDWDTSCHNAIPPPKPTSLSRNTERVVPNQGMHRWILRRGRLERAPEPPWQNLDHAPGCPVESLAGRSIGA